MSDKNRFLHIPIIGKSIASWRILFSPSLPAILLAAATISIVICFSLTLANTTDYAPDEKSHLIVTKHFSEHLRLQSDRYWLSGSERGHAYNLFSPIPYSPYQLAHITFYLTSYLKSRLTDASETKHFWQKLPHKKYRLRLRSTGAIFFGVLHFLAFFMLSKELFSSFTAPLGNFSHVLVATTLVMLPQLGVLASYVNADNFTILSSTAVVAFAFFLQRQRQLAQPQLLLSHSIYAGVLLSLLLHSKPSAYPIALPLAVVYCRMLLSTKTEHKLGKASLLLSIPLILAIPFHYSVFKMTGFDSLVAGKTHLLLMANTFKGAGEFNYYPAVAASKPPTVVGDARSDTEFSENALENADEKRLLSSLLVGLQRAYSKRIFTWHSMWASITKKSSASDRSFILLGFLCCISIAGCVLSVLIAKLQIIDRSILLFLIAMSVASLSSIFIMLLAQPVVIQGRLILPAMSLYSPLLILGSASFYKAVLALVVNLPDRVYLWGSCCSWIFLYSIMRLELLA